jgi:hypothetical protein
VSHLWSVFKPLGSQEQDVPLTHEDFRTKFYETYRREAEEYDREFIKKYDEDLNTTLIFVSFLCFSHVNVLTRPTGWSVLRSDFRIRHSGRLPAPAGPERGDGRSPPRPHPQDRQYHFQRRRSYRPTVVRSPKHDCPSRSHSLRKSRRFTLLRLPCDAWETMVEPIRLDRHARVGHRAEPESTTEARWHRYLVL